MGSLMVLFPVVQMLLILLQNSDYSVFAAVLM